MQNQDKTSFDRPVLNYSVPEPKEKPEILAARVLAVLLCPVMSLIGLGILILVFVAFPQIINAPSRDKPSMGFQFSIFFLIGLLMFVFGVRWFVMAIMPKSRRKQIQKQNPGDKPGL